MLPTYTQEAVKRAPSPQLLPPSHRTRGSPSRALRTLQARVEFNVADSSS
jgi:hypothetical protein